MLYAYGYLDLSIFSLFSPVFFSSYCVMLVILCTVTMTHNRDGYVTLSFMLISLKTPSYYSNSRVVMNFTLNLSLCVYIHIHIDSE